MSKHLVIVESPAKAKTIEKFLGSDYTVKSSFGHIRDLPKKGLSIDKENGFEPTYEISPEKKRTVAELRAAAKKVDDVWLASDEDREGEAIAWHLCQALKLDPKKTKRIVFHEITKPAIENAVKHPRFVDADLVDAQQARRVLDRLVGYELSPVLWKKVQTGLSAGRVQSVAVRLIVEREREIEAFTSSSKFKVFAYFDIDGQELKAELSKPLPDEAAARKFLEKAIATRYTIAKTSQKPSLRNPSAPFTTSSLQQEAATKLGFSVKQTMTLAQRLYENGHITYMRTDSTNLSQTALTAAESYIKKSFGDKYHNLRQYKTKNSSAQEAHEAIRPTDFNKTAAGDDETQKKLYQLIWRRALASQMTSAQIERTELTIASSNHTEVFAAKGETLQFDGFLRVYGGGKDDVILPPVKVGDELSFLRLHALESFDRPPARYSEASLVKKLEELGIGRPSTYAPTISTIQTRGYIEKRDSDGQERSLRNLTLQNDTINEETTTEMTGVERNKLLPTYLADIATDFLTKHFAPIVDYDFTAKAEAEFDDIAEGKTHWNQMIKEFYADFTKLIDKSADVSREETSQSRELGPDPKTGKLIVARYGKYGPMLQKGLTEDEEKPAFAPLPAGSTLTTVTLEQALEMFTLPREVGKTDDGQVMSANIGRFGPYIKVGSLFVSIKPHDPMTITEDEARELYKEKLEKEANKYVKRFDGGVDIVNGPYGAYITDGKKNARIPKDQKPEEIDEKMAKELLEKAPARKKRFSKRKK
jgi:DNA topoisomerase-1